MADFSVPFGQDAEFRYPSSTESAQGFPCGPADQELFNGLFRQLQAEVGSVIDFAGITQTNDRMTLLREAIEALIEAATGGGDPSTYLLMGQARGRLPIYPIVQNVDGRIVITAPATGTVRLPGGVEFLHRGIFPITTSQTDFNTDPSKTYHLRWHSVDGFVLRDLAAPAYNPTLLAEINPIFDSKYDDMLIARVITNASNVATITNLSNVDRTQIHGEVVLTASDYPWEGSNPPSALVNVMAIELNLARRPLAIMTGYTEGRLGTVNTEHSLGIYPTSRYRVSAYYQRQDGIGDGLRMAYSVSL